MKIMVREMSLIRGLGAPAKEMSVPHLLALVKDHSCLLLPTIARHCPRLPAKKCRKPWWPRNTAVDLAARDVSRAPLRDSPAVRLSQRIMNQGLSCRAAQAGANSEVFTKHESRDTNHGLFSPWVRQGGATGNHRPDHCARRQAAVSRFTVVRYCSPLFSKKYCSAPVSRAARSLLRSARSRGMERLSRGMRGGVGSEPSVCASSVVLSRPLDTRRSPQLLSPSGLLPLPRTQNEPF